MEPKEREIQGRLRVLEQAILGSFNKTRPL